MSEVKFHSPEIKGVIKKVVNGTTIEEPKYYTAAPVKGAHQFQPNNKQITFKAEDGTLFEYRPNWAQRMIVLDAAGKRIPKRILNKARMLLRTEGRPTKKSTKRV